MGLSDAGFCATMLAAFSLVLPLYWVCPFLQVFCEVPSIRSSSAIYLGLVRTFTLRPRKLFSLAWILGPIMEWAGPTNSRAPQKLFRFYFFTFICIWSFLGLTFCQHCLSNLFDDSANPNSVVPNFNLVNRESLGEILKAKVFIHFDGQLRAAYLILGYTPIFNSFLVPKCVIKANDPCLQRISVAAPGFLLLGLKPEGIQAKIPIPKGIPKTGVSSHNERPEQPLRLALPT